MYLAGEFFCYHYQLDDFFQCSLRMEQENNLWTAQPFKRLGCKFTLWTASAIPGTGRDRWRVQAKDLWPPSLWSPSSLCLEIIIRNSPQMQFPRVRTSPILCTHCSLLQQSSTINTCALHSKPGHAPKSWGHGWSPRACSSALGPWFLSLGFKIS